MDQRNAEPHAQAVLTPEELKLTDAWWRAANYLSAGATTGLLPWSKPLSRRVPRTRPGRIILGRTRWHRN
jgi:hypothetical protein